MWTYCSSKSWPCGIPGRYGWGATEFVSAGQNMHLTLWDRKRQWHIPSWNKPSLEPRSLKAQGGERGDDALALADATKSLPVAVPVVMAWESCICIANFLKIIVASGDRFAFCGQLRIFFLLGFGFLFFFFGTLCWLWICVRFFFWI
jgi:hypothetical protein